MLTKKEIKFALYNKNIGSEKEWGRKGGGGWSGECEEGWVSVWKFMRDFWRSYVVGLESCVLRTQKYMKAGKRKLF